MALEFDVTTTVVAFAVLIAVGVGALLASPMMTTNTVLMMVLPSMVVFGAIVLVLGIKHGEHRATR